MNRRRLAKERSALRALQANPFGCKASKLERIAIAVGRTKAARGKEPAWIREREPSLAPPLSIPHHAGSLPPGTTRSIVRQLLADCDEWEQHINDTEGGS